MGERLIAVTGQTDSRPPHLRTGFAPAGFSVRAIVRRPSEVSGCENVTSDILDADQMAIALAGASAVVHLAAGLMLFKRNRRMPLRNFAGECWEQSRARVCGRTFGRRSRSGEFDRRRGRHIGHTAQQTILPRLRLHTGSASWRRSRRFSGCCRWRKSTAPSSGPHVFGPDVAIRVRCQAGCARRAIAALGGIGGKRSMIYATNLAAAIGPVLTSPIPNGHLPSCGQSSIDHRRVRQTFGVRPWAGRPASCQCLWAYWALSRLGRSGRGGAARSGNKERLRRVVGPYLGRAPLRGVNMVRPPVSLDDAMPATARGERLNSAATFLLTVALTWIHWVARAGSWRAAAGPQPSRHHCGHDCPETPARPDPTILATR